MAKVHRFMLIAAFAPLFVLPSVAWAEEVADLGLTTPSLVEVQEEGEGLDIQDPVQDSGFFEEAPEEPEQGPSSAALQPVDTAAFG